MNSILLVFPIVVPLLASIMALFAWNRMRVQRVISAVSAVLLLFVSLAIFRGVRSGGILVMQMGDWPAPIGITVVADLLSAIMVMLTALISFAVILFSLVDIDRQRMAFGYYPLVNVLIMGINGAFLTGDIFNLYVWFEVLLIASFVLLGLGGSAAQLQGTGQVCCDQSCVIDHIFDCARYFVWTGWDAQYGRYCGAVKRISTIATGSRDDIINAVFDRLWH